MKAKSKVIFKIDKVGTLVKVNYCFLSLQREFDDYLKNVLIAGKMYHLYKNKEDRKK